MKNLRDVISGYTEVAIEKYKVGLGDVNYTVDFGFVPLPQGVAPAWLIMLSSKSPILGQLPLTQLGMIAHPEPDQKIIEDCVLDNLETIRTTRAQLMNGGNPALPPND